MSNIYDADLPAGATVIDLSPASEGKQELTPETLVYVINRGHETLVRKFDGMDYPLHPHTKGFIRMPYGAALHFQKHCTVPGTRDAASGAEQSYIGILGIDRPEWCEPFMVEECETFGQRIEALQREPGEEITVVAVGRQVASGKVPVGRGQSTGRRKLGFAKKGVTANGDRVDREDVMSVDADETAEERIARINADVETEA